MSFLTSATSDSSIKMFNLLWMAATWARRLSCNRTWHIQRLKDLVRDTPDQVLRLRVDSGGCSGFQYTFSLEKAPSADDVYVSVDLQPLHAHACIFNRWVPAVQFFVDNDRELHFFLCILNVALLSLLKELDMDRSCCAMHQLSILGKESPPRDICTGLQRLICGAGG
jgi:hypothetical protein